MRGMQEDHALLALSFVGISDAAHLAPNKQREETDVEIGEVFDGQDRPLGVAVIKAQDDVAMRPELGNREGSDDAVGNGMQISFDLDDRAEDVGDGAADVVFGAAVGEVLGDAHAFDFHGVLLLPYWAVFSLLDNGVRKRYNKSA